MARLVPRGGDKYGRQLCEVFTERGEDAAEVLLREGLARPWGSGSHKLSPNTP
jgi:endonuclease YncB( thermonuclease family)